MRDQKHRNSSAVRFEIRRVAIFREGVQEVAGVVQDIKLLLFLHLRPEQSSGQKYDDCFSSSLRPHRAQPGPQAQCVLSGGGIVHGHLRDFSVQPQPN